jgi:cell division protein FtsQ
MRSTREGGRTDHAERAVVVEPARRPVPSAGQAGALPWVRVDPSGKSPSVVTHRAQERIREKQRVERRHRMSVGARRLAYVAIALAAGWLALLSPVFALDARKVEVSGTGAIVDPALVAATVAPYEGRSLATLNTGHISNQLMDLPGVRDAVVDRVWPAGLRITITTRVAVAAIARPEGGYVLLDDQAVQVAVIEAVPGDVPVVAIPLDAGDDRILDTVITVINELPAELRARVGAVSAATEDSVQFQLRDGPRVEWGSAEQSALKASVLQTILGSAQAQTAAVIDVSAPTLPITRAS